MLTRTITFLEKDYNLLQSHLFKDSNEQAAYLLCSLSKSESEIRFIVKEVIPVDQQDVKYNNPITIYYTADSYIPVISKAIEDKLCFIMVHCHPNGFIGYSELDDQEEIKLLRYAYNRITDKFHGSLVFNDSNTFAGRILEPKHETYEPINKIRIIGDTYRFINSVNDKEKSNLDINIFNRNILAFGEDLVKVLREINIGVVGCGGTGSAVIEELCRLGVGKLTLVDNDEFDSTNITRVHESKLSDVGQPKVEMMKKVIDNIGLETKVIAIDEKLDNENTAKKLKDCDLIFSCLDYTDYARAILNQLCIMYYIPVIDMGIKFDSRNGQLNDIFGRIDVVLPNGSCLFCRKVIDTKRIAAEQMSDGEYEKLKNEGYAPELPKDKVQAMPYNTLIGSYAVTDMIQLLTNFKEKNSYHTFYRFIANKISSPNINIKHEDDCICRSSMYLGRGDTDPFLLMTWRG